MSLSDELLGDGRLADVRQRVARLAEALGARAAFLVDEEGAPFAACGQIDFAYPDPLSPLVADREGAGLLEALVGEPAQGAAGERLFVERVGHRALLAVVFDAAPPPARRSAARASLRRAAAELAAAIETGRAR